MKVPRQVSGSELARALKKLGYAIVRQEGSHLRLTCDVGGQHHVTVPNHRSIKVGTLRGILVAVARHHGLTVEEVLQRTEL